MFRFLAKTVALIVFLAAGHTLAARDFVLAVGSSTVYPFAATAAERIGKNTRFKTPQVEARGSGGGFKLFCKGGGADARYSDQDLWPAGHVGDPGRAGGARSNPAVAVSIG